MDVASRIRMWGGRVAPPEGIGYEMGYSIVILLVLVLVLVYSPTICIVNRWINVGGLEG